MVSIAPSPHVISQDVIVSNPGSTEDRLSVYNDPSSTVAAPLIVSVGATLSTMINTVSIPTPLSSSVTV